MDSFASNYIKPRGSNLKNTNASLITQKRQAQTIFTGYERQVESINQGFNTQRGTAVFNGSDGPAVANLKNGDTWTSPETLNAILTTNYCYLSDTCSRIYPYEIKCSDLDVLQYITLSFIGPFTVTYDHDITNTGIVELFFFNNENILVGSQIIDLTNQTLVTPVNGTSSTTVGYSFKCTPLDIKSSSHLSGVLNPGTVYTFTNDSGSTKLFTLVKQDSNSIVQMISDGETYVPSPKYGYTSYIFS